MDIVYEIKATRETGTPVLVIDAAAPDSAFDPEDGGRWVYLLRPARDVRAASDTRTGRGLGTASEDLVWHV